MADVPSAILDRVRPICLGLPETYEESAWIGVRWRVRKKTFAHLVTLEQGAQGAFRAAARDDRDTTVVTFRAPGEEVAALAAAGPPYFLAGWGRNVVGIVLDDDTDWHELAELLTESFCVMAPQKLSRRVVRPPDSTDQPDRTDHPDPTDQPDPTD